MLNSGNSTIERFAPGSTSANLVYSVSFIAGDSLVLFDPRGNLYVANYVNFNVREYFVGGTEAGVGSVVNPEAMATDSSGDVYVATLALNGNGQVERFRGSVPWDLPRMELAAPRLVVDASGNVYVSSQPNSAVLKITGGSTLTVTTYPAGLSQPTALAFDTSGNLYVASSDGASVNEYARGGTTASSKLTGLSAPTLWHWIQITTSTWPDRIQALSSSNARGSTNVSATFNGVASIGSLAIDSSGNVYAANSSISGTTVSRFAPGAATASATYSAGLLDPVTPKLDSSGNLYVASMGNNTVVEFARGSTVISATYSTGLNSPDMLAIDASGNLYVANEAGNTIIEFAAEAPWRLPHTRRASLSQMPWRSILVETCTLLTRGIRRSASLCRAPPCPSRPIRSA